MLTFNTVLTQAGIDPANVRLLRHSPQVGNRSLIDVWRTEPDLLTAYQAIQPVDGRSSFARTYWASFIGTWDGRTMFAGLFEVQGRDDVQEATVEPLSERAYAPGTVDRYTSVKLPTLADYEGRLFIDWGGGPSGKRAWNQRADAQDKAITELRTDITERSFPGQLKINAPLSEISAMPPTWIEHLQDARGVYLLSCPRDGALYVGSATAVGGFWARWSAYLADGHGGNLGLRDREPSDFYATVLQVAGSGDTLDDILTAEASWKEKLRTRVWGLNRN